MFDHQCILFVKDPVSICHKMDELIGFLNDKKISVRNYYQYEFSLGKELIIYSVAEIRRTGQLNENDSNYKILIIVQKSYLDTQFRKTYVAHPY